MRVDTDPFAALARIAADPDPSALEGRSDAQVGALVPVAVAHRVDGALALAMRRADRPLPAELVASTDAAAVRHLLALRALDVLRDALDGASVPWVVVKGPALAARWGAAAAVRPYDDLDLLVAPGSFETAVEAIRDAGFSHRNRNWDGFRRMGVGELPLDDGNVVVDLHWSLLGLGRHRRDLDLSADRLVARRVEVSLGGRGVPTLDDEDTLVHLCCHAALAGAQLLSQLVDVHLVARTVDPDRLRVRLDEAGATRLAAVVLARSERVFGPATAFGPPLADRIAAPAGWSAVNRVVDRTWPTVARASWTPFPGSLVRAGRRSVPATARAVATELAASARAHLGLRTEVTEGGPLDWSCERGGASSYRRYLDEVASGGFG